MPEQRRISLEHIDSYSPLQEGRQVQSGQLSGNRCKQCNWEAFLQCTSQEASKLSPPLLPRPSKPTWVCKEAQTVDHIFTLDTCISKYIKQGKRLNSGFIDFKKAFDSIQREALLFKSSQLNIKRKFFDCIHHMYSHSKAKIKMTGKLSEAIKVQVGTEQGHPMSPELFKIFLLDLSKELNDAIGHSTQTPKLNNTSLSHLLWADDLVLLALDRSSLQHLINVVHHFCNRWGLEVNKGKTAILVFKKSGRLLRKASVSNTGISTFLLTKLIVTWASQSPSVGRSQKLWTY